MSDIETLKADLLKAIGDNHAEQAVNRWIDTGNPELNKIISGKYDGGLPFGRIVEIIGPSSLGKTAMATQCMVEAQRMGGVAIFIDWERSFDVHLAEGFGLNAERPYWIYAKPKTWEEGNTLAAKACQVIRNSKVIPDEAPILVVFDSVASAVPKSVYEKGIEEYSMNDTTALARVTSSTLKPMAQFAEEFGATYIYLNQIRQKIGVLFGSDITSPGGKAMEFYASTRLSLEGRQKNMDKNGDKTFLGQTVTVKCIKSKFTRPFQECKLHMEYDDMGVAHYDHITPLIDSLADKGLLNYSKPYVTWTDGKKYYKSVLATKLKEEPDGLEQLKAFLLK